MGARGNFSQNSEMSRCWYQSVIVSFLCSYKVSEWYALHNVQQRSSLWLIPLLLSTCEPDVLWCDAASGCWFQCLYNEWRGLFGWSYEWRAILGWGSCKEQVMVLRCKVLSHFASHSLFVLSDPIGNPNLTGFSILLASSTLPFDRFASKLPET